ncbi:aroma-sacti cluster domain-containing protein [Streptomyces sp. NBC_00503]|uniref:aroma-sacti cluster domain-containing protein n=1 Tax=Streptomyces sp. NBC_00503 TaxID=2903659 RepID=UPI002E80FB25|nr:aroma-sacti cluster domain-containing protein [Streptomyces sp. NBC_00503]WUD79565.1 LuxR C-terminal-related transcriptional regulator [Streptomyces sp. NBC_00503]
MTSIRGPEMSTRGLMLVAMVARGHTTDRVARALRLSRHTVGEEISVLLDRFKCKNRAELVAYCYVHRILPIDVWPPPCGPVNGVSDVFDPLTALREAGLPVDQLSTAQREVLAHLTEEEAAVIVAVQHRLNQADSGADAEVWAHDLKML